MSGKGDRPRPLGVDKDKFNSEFDRIFNGKKKKPKKDKPK